LNRYDALFRASGAAMRRREFITLVGGAAVWPLAAGGQQIDRMRRIATLMAYTDNDPEGQILLRAFAEALAELGWKSGRNAVLESRWAGGDVDQMQRFAKELVAMQPDVILANTTPVIAAVQPETRTIPIIFVVVSDPIGDGFVASLARSGGNITGFLHLEASIGGKWLELLKEVAPELRRAAIMFNPATAPGGGHYYLPVFEAAARTFGMDSIVAPVRSDDDIEAAIASLANQPGGGLVVMSDGFVRVHRKTIIMATARLKIPAVYPLRVNALDGGLLAYGPSYVQLFRQAAPYVDRILRGERPAELPVQVPTRFELVINLKTASTLGLMIPQKLLTAADEVIE
jgi:putative tryptophan/tyrosine transport system substrate-binding protein